MRPNTLGLQMKEITVPTFDEVPAGVTFLQKILSKSKSSKEVLYRVSVLLLTFLAYVAYHASRKPISIVKNSKEFLDCSADKNQCHSWITEIDGKPEDEAKTLLGLLDTTFLVSYAFFMFISGIVAERVDLRVYLAFGMVGSGIFTFLFGFAYFAGIHSIWYLLMVQVIGGMFQTTGWPGVVTVMANWFGKGKRGLIMGIWNSHTSIGNILGALLAGAFVNENWGLSFAIPGLLIFLVGILIFLFLVTEPAAVGITAPKQGNRTLTPSSSVNQMSSDVSPKHKDLLTPGTLTKTASSSRLIDSAYESDQDGFVVPKDCQAIGFVDAMRIPGVIEFSLCLFFAKLVSYTFLFWLPNYISSTSGFDAKSSATLSTFFDVGGIIGGIIAGVISDKSGMSATTCTGMLIAAIPTMFLYQVLQGFWCPMSQIGGLPVLNECYFLNVLVLVITGLLVNGPYALITTAVSAELGTHKSLQNSGKALATVTAIIDGTGSIGAAVGPFLAGWLAGDGNWDTVFSMLMVADVFALLLLVRLMKHEVRRCWRRRFAF
eukprot:TRINITY_DN38153_c0_g1_i1.p1 TRINITY_DN38153_c0_g1~~TRINITY_DN38153_c0_g1_i1.p1  ORF type:complete len:546 (+),score=106.84 TRINITY_DN38153_c0_g1_i1:133-1770(+)